jgi:hypothetical protein
MIVYLHAALDERLSSGRVVTNEDVERSVIADAVLRLRCSQCGEDTRCD